METVLWCAVGAFLGWVGGRLGGPRGLVNEIESMGVGVFGAFIGGDFLAFYVLQADGKSHMLQQFGMAAGAAVVALLLLRLMRKAVGPPPKTTKRKRS